MNFPRAAFGLALCSVLGACTTVPSIHRGTEVQLGTDDGDSQQYHAVVHYPFEHALRFPGLVIGIEKSSAATVKKGALASALRPVTDPTKADKWLWKLLIDHPKSMFISHVVKTSAGTDLRIYADPEPCFIYDAYRSEAPDRKHCPNWQAVEADPFSRSWSAIRGVKNALESDLKEPGRFTHVVLIVMGWNTNQIEAVQNFNSIIGRMARTAEQGKFRPYVIGVTWPSQWDSSFFEPVVRAVSLFNKANDADEVGGGWLGGLLQFGILPVTGAGSATSTPLMVIGHSFGARASSHAVCRETMLLNPPYLPEAPESARVQWLISLQGAYSMNRFSEQGAGYADLAYERECPRANNFIFTASENDQAAALGGFFAEGGNFSGTLKSYVEAKASGFRGSTIRYSTFKTTLAPGTAKGYGSAEHDCGAATNPNGRFRYVDASNVIYFNAYGTGAGAHSDVYRSDTARMLWKLMDDQYKYTCPDPK